MKIQQLYLPTSLQVFNLPPMALGKQIRFHRESQGLTLEQLSDRSGVDVGTISALEVRESKRSQYASQLAAALGLSLDALFSNPEDRPTGGQVTDKKFPKGWPFERITPEQWKKLSPSVWSDIEDYIEMKVTKATPPTGSENKHAA